MRTLNTGLYKVVHSTEDTGFETRVEDRTLHSIQKPANCQSVDNNMISSTNAPSTICDDNSSEVSGDLNKLQMMTAVDFDRDRYARYGIHESEIKDYVRTITYKNSIEYCTEKYIKVNIFNCSTL